MRTAAAERKLAFDKPQALLTIKNYLADGSESEELVHIIDKTVEVVLARHYSKYLDLTPEFRSAVYQKIFKVLPAYDFSRDIFTWLYTIARNEAHNFIYYRNKDRNVFNNFEDISEIPEDTIDELSIEQDLIDQESQLFIDNCFPITRYIIGEALMDFLTLLRQLDIAVVAGEDTLFSGEETVHQFSIFASFYLRSDAFLHLYAYYKLFAAREDFGAMLVALASIRSKLPNVRTIKKIVDDYIIFMKQRDHIACGTIPENMVQLQERLSVYPYTLKQVLECLEGDRIVDTRLFSRQ